MLQSRISGGCTSCSKPALTETVQEARRTHQKSAHPLVPAEAVFPYVERQAAVEELCGMTMKAVGQIWLKKKRSVSAV